MSMRGPSVTQHGRDVGTRTDGPNHSAPRGAGAESEVAAGNKAPPARWMNQSKPVRRANHRPKRNPAVRRSIGQQVGLASFDSAPVMLAWKMA
jgi:hypothetical protein